MPRALEGLRRLTTKIDRQGARDKVMQATDKPTARRLLWGVFVETENGPLMRIS